MTALSWPVIRIAEGREGVRIRCNRSLSNAAKRTLDGIFWASSETAQLIRSRKALNKAD
jgi:hypothetical protein